MGSLKLHHESNSLLVDILQQICQWVFHLVELLSHHKETLVQLQFNISDRLCLLFPHLILLVLDIFKRDYLLPYSLKDLLSLLILERKLLLEILQLFVKICQADCLLATLLLEFLELGFVGAVDLCNLLINLLEIVCKVEVACSVILCCFKHVIHVTLQLA